MTLTGVFINSIGVFLAGLTGSFCKKGIPEKVRTTLMMGLGLCVLYIGISSITAGTSIIMIVLSIAIGAVVGERIDIDDNLNRMGKVMQKHLTFIGNDNIADGFVAGTLFVCVGAMSIVGGIESGTQGTFNTFVAKALIDSVVIFIMATTKGIGCCLSAFVALIYQTALTLSASFIAQFLNATITSEMSQIGAILIVGIALNILQITHIKIGNLILSPFMPILLHLIIAIV
ncbi:DUF554 domain-containing protein [Oscillibacter sp.]|uniref:DUF554 domain-containing protein n=1 Tax=Oscillibacter sp. TaxID=1945593 RepID=UPI0028A6AF83|nr:DUF554 domain-containing protein [Oscillibacter sp.]